MNEIVGVVRAQMDALLELLERARAAHCREARDKAEWQAADWRKRARRDARERVGKAAREERERLEHEIRMARAEIDTELRKQARVRDLELIRAGRVALGEALAQRWRNAAAQREWVEAALAEAAGVLLGRNWTLEHPADWPAGARAAAVELAGARHGAKIELRATADLDAGLRILEGGAGIDMSIAGLMANARTIEGELLAEIRRTAPGERS
jgi:hypothetical protein